MKSKFTALLMAALSGLALTPNLHAQPSAFTYQGRLIDNGGPANGLYDLTFTLWDAMSGAQQGGTITNAATAVSNGLFTVMLDFGAASFNGEGRLLEIGVRPGDSGGPFTSLVPRQPITSTPYAIRAANAASASSVAATNITGTIATTQLPAAVVTNGASGVNISGTFSGNGAGVTNVDLFTSESRDAIRWQVRGGGGFVIASSLSVGRRPYFVTTADVNGDGRPDLISTDSRDNRLSVLTNDGSGGFVLSSTPGVGTEPRSIATVDVNSDGEVDLITANFTNATLTVLTNDGSGGFGISSSPEVGRFPTSVTAADVNGDGKVDVISANSVFPSTLSVLTNDGSGGFVLSASPGVGSSPESVTTADVNGDGTPDLISVDAGANALSVLTNNGSGGFMLSSSPSVGFLPWSVTAVDVNGDGQVDLISADSASRTLSVLTNNGSGGFVLSSSPAVERNPRCVTAADVNGDGRVDLISANDQADALSVLTNDGSGGFVLFSSPGVGDNPQFVTAADVNGDGAVDLISANNNAFTLTVLTNIPVITGEFHGDGSALTGLSAAHITGTLGAGQIPDLDASKITSGTLDTARIPALDATKLGAGTVDNTEFGYLNGLTSGIQGQLNGKVSKSGDAMTGILTLSVPGGASGQRGLLALRGTFQNLPSDTTPRRVADIVGGFATGTWGTEYLALKVGNGGVANDTQAETLEKMRLTSSGNMGIGTTNPTERLHVSGNILASGNISASGNILATGNVLASGNVGIGTASPSARLHVSGISRFEGSLNVNHTGFGNCPVTIAPQAAQDFALIIEREDRTGNLLYMATERSSSGPALVINSGNTGYRGTALYVYGAATKSWGGDAWSILSDERLKQNIRSYDRGLDDILKLRTVRFEYRDDPAHGTRSGHEEIGLIAQEAEKVFPEAVSQGADGYRTLNASPIRWATINAIQELNRKLEETRAENAALKSRFKKFEQKEAEITELKQTVSELKELIHSINLNSKGEAR